MSGGAGAEVREERTRDGERIDTGVAEEIAVLGREHRRAACGGRQLGVRAEHRPLAADHRQHLWFQFETGERPGLNVA